MPAELVEFLERIRQKPDFQVLHSEFIAAAIQAYSLHVERGIAIQNGCSLSVVMERVYQLAFTRYTTAKQKLVEACARQNLSCPHIDLISVCNAIRGS